MDFATTVQRHRAFFQSGATRPLEFRREQLQSLSAALDKNESRLLDALQADLGKSPFQGYASEIGMAQAEIRHALNNLRKWASPKRRGTPWFAAPSRGWVQPEPFGVALIFSPWNYPAQLLLCPLASAIAAGNCAVLKPSELAPCTSEALAEMVKKTFADDFVSAVTGGPDIAQALLRERFDKIFFTGSTNVGREVMTAAAKHLTPVTLELGGKCPAIICEDAPIELTARRLVWGKFLNAGQTCVAPDFVLVHRRIRNALVDALKASIQKFYGDDASRSADYGRIVNARHFERLENYLSDGKIVHGGEKNAKELYLAPTILTEAPPDAPVMREEIFGPILPVLDFEEIEETIAFLRDRPTSLALYLFTGDSAVEKRVLAETRSGGACVNDVISHMIGASLPFGGLGESGMGAYHGRAGFEAFSHQRSVLRRSLLVDIPVRYPPQKISLAWMKRLFGFLMRD